MDVKSMAVIIGAISVGWVGGGRRVSDLISAEDGEVVIDILEQMTEDEFGAIMKRIVTELNVEIKKETEAT